MAKVIKTIFKYDVIILALLAVIIITLPFSYSVDYVQAQTGYLFLLLLFIPPLIIFFTIKYLFVNGWQFQITSIDIVLLIYLLISFLSNSINTIFYSMSSKLELTCLIILYLIVRSINIKHTKLLLFFLLIAGCLQALFGNLQLYGFYPSNHSFFKMTGSFMNPGPFAGYLATILPIGLTFIILKNRKYIGEIKPSPYPVFKQVHTSKLIPKLLSSKLIKHVSTPIHKHAQYIFRLVVISTMIAIILVLPATKSRAAWLAFIVSISFILFKGRKINPSLIKVQYWEIYPKIRKLIRNYFFKIIIVLLLLIISICSIFFVYQMKKKSVEGRFLIWKVSAAMIKDNPFLGHGDDQFAAKYMDYQASYFKENPDSEEIYVADNNKYAFNEFIRVSVELGLFGLISCIILLVALFKGGSDYLAISQKVVVVSVQAAILSSLVFGWFSYPSAILPIKFNFILFVALMANYKKGLSIPYFRNRITKTVKHSTVRLYSLTWISRMIIQEVIIVTIISSVVYSLVSDGYELYKSNKHWKSAFVSYQMGAYELCVKDYKLAFSTLKSNGDFMLNYGKALSMAEMHDDAIKILNMTKKLYPNTVLYTALGDSFKALGQPDEAEKAYVWASCMIPSRFYPRYLLANLYFDTNQKEKALEIANEILAKEVKINSKAIDEIRTEMLLLVNKTKE